MGISESIVLGLALLGAACFGLEAEFHCKQVGEVCNCWDKTPEDDDVSMREYTCRVVYVMSSHLENLPSKVFTMSENVRELYVKKAGLYEIHESDFVDAENLTVLHLDSNEIHCLNANTFRYAKNLETLEMAYNYLDDLDPDCFNGSSNIRVLNFHANMISELPERIFANLKRLTQLILVDNYIEHLPDNIFNENENLEVLDLRHNMLTTVQPGSTPYALSGLGFLATLRNLKRLFLSGNILAYIGNETFVNNSALQELHLSRCHLKHVEDGAFAGNTKLTRLDISHNELHDISFGHLKHAQEVNLISNSLREIDYENIFTPNSSIKVYLRANPWDCSFVRRMQNYMRDNGIAQMRYIYGWDDVHVLETECVENYVQAPPTATLTKAVRLLSTKRPTLEVESTSLRQMEPPQDNPLVTDATDVSEKPAVHNYIFVFFVIFLFLIEISMLIGLIVITIQKTFSRLKGNNVTEEIELL